MKSEDFIKAQESRWFILMFDLYVRSLFFRRFKRVWIQQSYHPLSDSRTIYYLNHTSWWDGLIPFLLNRKRFRQKARAMMEDKQMKEHRFFRKIGAFSVNLDQKKAMIASLRYAVDSLQEPGRSLFIFPEGKINPFTPEKPDFQKGLSWIASKCPDADVVPVGVFISNQRHDKPECYLKVGQKVSIDNPENSEMIHQQLESEMGTLLTELRSEMEAETFHFKKLL
ncbi:MAG: hypothetical protein EA360_10995 [Balneolaceae bacterium]|nr:MAG: hypothetical protein EA360_10995 [Balneolaceae bacterium]